MDADILLVGGAPRVPVDAVRHLTVAASGRTAVRLQALLQERGLRSALLLGTDAVACEGARRYTDRAGLDAAVQAWAGRHPQGRLVLSAAVNDYEVARLEADGADGPVHLSAGGKLPSGCRAVRIHLRPAAKLVDELRRSWSWPGRLFCFKYEAAATVLDSAQALCRRVGASAVLANSLCGTIQALVDADGVTPHADRDAALQALADRIAAG
ncbi:MAG: phosphopantothenoylcysteine decarboxylase [Planctomycetota bacterium]